jgi:hypothetical protein
VGADQDGDGDEDVKLIPDWRDAWKWLSVHALTVAGLLPGVWVTLPADWRAAVPAGWMAGAALVVAAFGVYGRLIDQKPKPDPTDEAGA